MHPDLETLDQADAELSAAIRPAVFELLTGALPFLTGLLAVAGMIRRRRQIRRARTQLLIEAQYAEANHEILVDGPPTCAEEEAGGVDAETVLRIKLALPDWARLEQDPGSGRWMILDTATATAAADEPDPLVGADIICVLHAPGWARTMSDAELARWAADLGRHRHHAG